MLSLSITITVLMNPDQLLNCLLMSPATKQVVMHRIPEMLSEVLEVSWSSAGSPGHPSRVRTPEAELDSQPHVQLALNPEGNEDLKLSDEVSMNPERYPE